MKKIEKITGVKKSEFLTSPYEEYIKVGIPGLDNLFEHGIPKCSLVLVAGGAGSGKTIFCLQTLNYQASLGKKCLYMTFEENEEKLKWYMKRFGWDADKLIKSKVLKIIRYSPFDIANSVDAIRTDLTGSISLSNPPFSLPENYKPDFVVIDSLTAIASAFIEKKGSYRAYAEQLLRFFEKLGSTVFLVSETTQIPEVFSTTGIEEFLADGVITLYNIRKKGIRENAIEILKMRGEKHQKKIVAMRITDKGIVVYPEQEVFGSFQE